MRPSYRVWFIPFFIVLCLFAIVWLFPTGVVEASVFSSLFNIFLFVGFFQLSIYASTLAVRRNEWVYEVKHMKYLFNPSFMTWLFATNRERWAKWTTLECYIGTLIIGPLFFLTVYSITGISVVGVLLSLVILGVFTYFFYLSYLTLLESSEKQSD